LTTAIYPGSFDPVTMGHIDIARRAAAIFDHLVVAVYDRPAKNLMFSTAERVALAERALEDLDNVEVTAFEGLAVDFARVRKAKVIVRGLRAISDFEGEMQMAHYNRKMAPELEVVCLMTSLELGFLSAHMVKEIVSLGGPSDGMVPTFVAEAMRRKLARVALGSESGRHQ
jgi:pantetheine-phosphate adenylyltransferase